MSVPRTVKGLSLVSLFNDVASEMVYPLLPALVTGPLGAGALVLGLLDGAAELTSAVLKVVSGRLADRSGWRAPLILSGYVTAVAARPLIAAAGAAWQVVGLRVVDRVGKGLRTPARDAWIAAVTPVEIRGRAFGFHRAADHFGAVLGSLAAWLLLEGGLGVRQVIAWSAVPGVLACLVLAPLLRRADPDRVGAAASPTAGQTDARGKVFWGPVVLLAALTFLRLPEALLLLRLQDLGVLVAFIPLVWAGLHVVRSAGSYPGGWLADHLGPRAAVAAGGLMFAAVAASLAQRLSATEAVAAFLLFGAVAGLTEAAERALVARLAPVRTGRGFGSYHAVVGAVALPAGLVFGALYQRLGGSLALRASAVGMVLAVGLWLIVTRSSSRGTMTSRWTAVLFLLLAAAAPASDAEAQVLIRVGDPARATYSELHEGLRAGTPAADSVLAVLQEKRPAALWRRLRAALRGELPWNDGPLALTRLAELRDRVYADSAARLGARIEARDLTGPPGQDPADLLAPLSAVRLERERATRGDAAVLGELLALIPTRRYGVGEAWVLGRLGHPASDSLQARFRDADDEELRVRYLTLLSFASDTSAIPLLARVYAAPDSFGVPPRYGSRASDALLWIGTRGALTALLAAREQARARGVYADPSLARGGYDYLANDSSAVISRTGKWLTEWIAALPGQQQRVGPSP